ncbi:uncharacterized protein LAJ45_08481 [Morchella importuna]|uniref:uncharacterized protein n=1 Tax=Morchella importuna TaxID=1174673 RepID=UPI001E8E47A2|nr:uncharacterized protein LAJ45_08481 [Morchella importuna]KAH8147325.1 hypothetical protein LAJ45_08481 [Morchella importuna]
MHIIQGNTVLRRVSWLDFQDNAKLSCVPQFSSVILALRNLQQLVKFTFWPARCTEPLVTLSMHNCKGSHLKSVLCPFQRIIIVT